MIATMPPLIEKRETAPVRPTSKAWDIVPPSAAVLGFFAALGVGVLYNYCLLLLLAGTPVMVAARVRRVARGEAGLMSSRPTAVAAAALRAAFWVLTAVLVG